MLLLSAGVLPGCSANPATGKRQLNFYNEAKEIEMGREADREISSQLGVLADAELTAYVNGIGQKLAAASERPHLPWSFKIVDDPVVNAFALPGGFIYVTRGLLGHVRSEAELASVLGHEIGHVTAQHSVNQLSKQQLAMGGLLLGSILSPEVAQAAGSDLGQIGLQALFLKYGRDDERQADDLGLRYMAGGAYETREMPEMFGVLQAVGEIQGGSRLPSWLSSHPDPGARRERAAKLIAERAYPEGKVGEEDLLRRLDGLAFGADPRQGFFEGDVFYHPGLAFQIEMPRGWQRANLPSKVVAINQQQTALVELALVPESTPEEAARAFLSQQGVEAGASARGRLAGFEAVQSDFAVPRQQDRIVGRAVFVEKDDRVYRLLGYGIEGRGGVDGEVGRFLDSFARLEDRAKLAAQPQKIEVVELPTAMSFDAAMRRWPSDADARVLTLINDIEDPAATLPAGTLLKTIQGQQWGKPG